MKTFNFEFRKRKIYEKVLDGMWSDAIIKYHKCEYLFERGGGFESPKDLSSKLYCRITYKNALRIDLFFCVLCFDWESKKRMLNPEVESLVEREDNIKQINLLTELAKREKHG